MKQKNRTSGGLIERNKPLVFHFNNLRYEGFLGDTLASALIANNQRLVARSFKYHRPRGIFSAGPEEPNALVQLRLGAHLEPNTRATVTELFDGLIAKSQNHLGSLEFDFLEINNLLSPLLSAGFYYKTFMWPKSFWEKIYEPIIRASAGLGCLSNEPDPDIYDKGFLHCDVLVIGGGPAGLAAALIAGRSGVRTILADEDFLIGGRLNAETFTINGMKGSDWAVQTAGELEHLPNVRLLTRTTVYGAFDHGVYGAVERCTDHLASSNGRPRQVLWRIYSKRTIVSTGATERPIAFSNNDRPGIMLAGSVRTYLNRWAVTPGKRVAIFTNNDDGWRTANDLRGKDINVIAVIDTRDKPPPFKYSDTKVFMGSHILDVIGHKGVTALKLPHGKSIEADCIAVAGGWNPNVHLTCHHRGRPTWCKDISAFIPGEELPTGMTVAGAANGTLALSAALKQGSDAGSAAAGDTGHNVVAQEVLNAEDEPSEISPFWHVEENKKRAWIDMQNDVTVQDIEMAYMEGFRSVEHVKRYTTLSMATDQGKTANTVAVAVLAELTGKTIPQTGVTIYRPPYTPVSISAFAGRQRGNQFRPTQLCPSHTWATEQNAVFVEAGLWKRAQFFPKKEENHWRQSVNREVLQTRKSVGVCDVTTLGKFDVQGTDALKFLNYIYANDLTTLAVGKVRYGLMLREDGLIMDDGTIARLAKNHYITTSTTANAAQVLRHMEFCHQCLWPNLNVHIISVTEQWGQFAISGPNSRHLLQKIVDREIDISNHSFPYMACSEITICNGIPARLFRISFSGELGYEIAIPARYGDALIRRLMSAGEEFDIVPYGTEALSIMRIEKGHPAGAELNGQTTARDLGMQRLVAKHKDFIGNILSKRPELNRKDGLALVGFIPIDRRDKLSAGAHFFSLNKDIITNNDEGWMTSVAISPNLGHSIGLGLIKRGNDRIGETVKAANLLQKQYVKVEIVTPHFIDPEGERLRA